MLFNSFQFMFLYLPIVLVVCYALASRIGPVVAQDWLALASLFFYGAWNLQFLPLLVASIVFNYLVAKLMLRAAGPGAERRRNLLLLVTVVIDLGLLGYYKYANFFVQTVDSLSGSDWVIDSILLPLGISFYTFQQITLLVDISKGSISQFRFRDFVLFVTFFPHLIAGPIVHHREMMPQFAKASYRFDPENLAVGLTLFAGGLFKKTVLADGIANHVVPLYTAANGGPMPLFQAWAAAVGFSLQIYFDFSGYSEMALGLARCVGITLPMNFNSPFKARSIIEFWMRWHMTLTRFLTAYVYNPIAVGRARRRAHRGQRGVVGAKTSYGAYAGLIVLPTVSTMFLSGLWHGAGNQFLIFGLLHGFYLTVCHGWRLYRPRFWPDKASHDRIMAPVGLVLTFVAVAIAHAYFRADTVSAGTNIVSGMFGAHGITLPSVIMSRLPGLAQPLAGLGVHFQQSSLPELLSTYVWLGVLTAIALVMPNLLQIMRAYQPALTLPAPYQADSLVHRVLARLRWQPAGGWAFVTAVAATMGILTLGEITEFLYWQF